MIRKRFTLAAVLCLAAILAPAAFPFHSPAGPAGALAADGVKAGQTLTVQYVVGTRTVKTQAVLGTDGLLQFACPTDEWPFSAYVTYRLVRQSGPEPKPDPKPDPKPTPVTKAIAMFVVYESRDPKTNVPKFAAIKNDQGWRKAADAAGLQQHVWDQDDPRFAKASGVLATAKARGLPVVVFVFADGTAKAEAIPDTPTAMAELVKKIGGVK